MTTDDHQPPLLAPRRAALLLALRGAGRAMSVRELAAAMGSHPNTCREQLARLVGAGLVTRTAQRSGRRGRPGWRYTATPSAAPGPASASPALARALVEHVASQPDASTRAVDAGRRWGRSMATDAEPVAPAERLLALLDEAGFAPLAPVRPGDPIGLRACPFGVFARGGPEAACAVHRGLIEGALGALGAPTDGVVLEPFVRPDLCLAHVGAPTHG